MSGVREVPAPQPSGRVSSLVVAAAMGPVVAALALLVFFAVSEGSGHTPFAYQSPRNLAEAAGMGSAAEVLRLLRAGEDPTAVVFVRPEVISSAVTRVSAVEAAVWSRSVELVELLDRQGAIPADRGRLACLATALETKDIAAYLAPSGVVDCGTSEIQREIEARSK